MDQEEVALRFQKYALISAAVVDEAGRLVGQLTVDDIVHIISEEAGEDAMLLSGAGEGDINQPIREAYSGRVRWLLANLVTASVASFVISRFEGVIAQLVTLAVLMPIVAGIGGNAGTQTLAVTVRALATNQLTSSNTWRAVRREVSIALLNGVSIAVVIGAVVTLIFGDVHLGVVIGLAMMTNILIAGFAGVLVPLTLDKMRADPAIASSIFVTMTTDSMGFLVFLGLAVATRLVP
jgi:magnesium transporter